MYEFGTWMDIGGSASCDSWVDIIEIKCWIVHRHSLYWHSHTDTSRDEAVFSGPRAVIPDGGGYRGTVGDKYKTHCDMRARHTNEVKWSRESSTITLAPMQ